MQTELDHLDNEALLQRKLELQKRRLQLNKDFGLAFYRPWAKQDQFHSANTRFRMMRMGNRGGKSTGGCAENLAWMIGERPWYKAKFDILNRDGTLYRHHEGGENHPLVRQGIPQRPTKQLLITTDWDKVKEIWTGQEGSQPGKIWQMVPKGFIKKTGRNHSGAIDLLVGANGSILRFDTVESFKKNPQGSESSDWDRIHVDEPCPEGQWKATSRGLMDRGGRGDFTLTPLSEFWINDMFFPRMDTKGRSSCWAVNASTMENPYLSVADIEEYMSSLTPDEIQCRIHGLPLELSGLVYKAFNYHTHVLSSVPHGWKDYNTPPDDYVIYYSIDPHPQTNHAVLFVAMSPTGQAFIFAELWIDERSISRLSGEILRVLRHYEVARGEADPLAWIPHPVTERTMADEFMLNGLVLTKASKDKTFGILNMQQQFSKKDYIYVNPNLNRFLFEINRYCYNKENVPVDKDDHLMECMYRIFLNEPQWYDPKKDAAPVDDIVINKRELDLQEVDLNPDF